LIGERGAGWQCQRRIGGEKPGPGFGPLQVYAWAMLATKRVLGRLAALLAAKWPCIDSDGGARHNRYDPDFRSSLPILLNWQRRRIRYNTTTVK
jgi:hypothetical protein